MVPGWVYSLNARPPNFVSNSKFLASPSLLDIAFGGYRSNSKTFVFDSQVTPSFSLIKIVNLVILTDSGLNLYGNHPVHEFLFLAEANFSILK